MAQSAKYNPRNFKNAEDGSVVLDWAILTVFVILTAGYFFDPVADQTLAIAAAIEQALRTIEIKTTF